MLTDTPRLSLAAGLNLDMEDIKVGDDVYFECGIQANPPVFKVQWFHGVSFHLHHHLYSLLPYALHDAIPVSTSFFFLVFSLFFANSLSLINTEH